MAETATSKISFPSGLKSLRKLGEGEGTIVWAVEEEASGRHLAIKLASDRDSARRLEREFAILERFQHPGIVKVESFVQYNEHSFFTMELIDGLSFASFLRNHINDKDFLNIFLRIVGKILTTLSFIHKEGVVHADLKPANLLIRPDGEPVLLDFGFAEDYILDPTREPRGTLNYVAPELFLGEGIGPAADLYSLGVMAYEVLAGKNLWENKSLRSLAAAKLLPPTGFGKKSDNIPGELQELVLRLLNPDPALRPSAAEAGGTISELLEDTEKLQLEASGFAPVLPFGGRDNELSLLEKLLFKEKQVVSLNGSAGSGKSRLLKELRFRALTKGFNVVLLSGRGAYLSLLDYLGATLGLSPEETQEGDTEQHYERVFQALQNSRIETLLLDLPGNLSAYEKNGIGFLARGLEGKLGLVLCGVDEAIHPEAYPMSVGSLDEKTIRELVSRSFEGLKEADSLSQTLFFISEGNPRLLSELLEILYREGWLTMERGWVFRTPEDNKSLSQKLDTWVTRKIQQLPKISRKAIFALALTGEPLPLKVLEQTLDFVEIQLLMLRLINARLVTTLTYLDAPHYQLANDIIREFALKEISTEEQQKLAAVLVGSLAGLSKELWGNDASSWDSTYIVQIASLYSLMKPSPKARPYLLAAGNLLVKISRLKQAKALLERLLGLNPTPYEEKEALMQLGRVAASEQDTREAEKFFTKALSLVEGDSTEESEILLRIGWSYQNSNQLDVATEFFNRCEETLLQANHTPKSDLFTARGWNALKRGQLDDAKALFQKSIDKAASDDEARRSIYSLAWVLFSKQNYNEALDYAHKVLTASKKDGDKALELQSSQLISQILQNLGRLNDAEIYVEHALELGEKMQHPIQIADTLRIKADIFANRGLYRQARSIAKQTRELLRRLHYESYDVFLFFSLLISEANQTRDLGEWDKAEQDYLDIWKKLKSEEFLWELLPYALREWAYLYQLKGRFSTSERLLKKAKKIASKSNDQNSLLWVNIRECKLNLALGNYTAVRNSFKVCEHDLEEVADIPARINVSLIESELLINEGEAEKAYRIGSKALEEIRGSGFDSLRGNALRICARAMIAAENYNEGLNYLRDSAQIFKEQEDIYEQGASLYEVAEFLFAQNGYSDEAVSAIEEANTLFERIGAKERLEIIEHFKAEHFDDWREGKGLSDKYLTGLKRISELINYRLGEEDFMIQVLSAALELTGADRGMVFLTEGTELYSVASKAMDTTTARDARRVSRTIIQQMQHGLKPVYTADATQDERFKRSQSILLNNIRSFLCVPLKTGERIMGTIYLDSQQMGLFNADNLLYFEAMGNFLAATIEQSSEFKKLRAELRLARERDRLEQSGIVMGNTRLMQELYGQMEQAATSDANILLEGETGTGKGVFARMIHEKGPRRGHEFCSVNCGAVPENIFETELFGYHKGAFTDAHQDRPGLLEAADGSTVFFDEITNTSLTVQAKLLEVIEERVIRRVGETKTRRVDLRFIFATNRNLKEEVREGRFREDLFFRINALKFSLPPLRERREDIPEFVAFFVEKFARELNKDVIGVDKEVLEAFLNYDWPGNIRELRNVIERAVLLAPTKRINRNLLDQRFFPEVPLNLKDTRTMQYKELIHRTLLETRGNITHAAKRLGITRQHLSRLVKHYEIPRPQKG